MFTLLPGGPSWAVRPGDGRRGELGKEKIVAVVTTAKARTTLLHTRWQRLLAGLARIWDFGHSGFGAIAGVLIPLFR